MARLDPNLVKKARENLLQLVAMEKDGFAPPPAEGAMPPPGAGAMPPPGAGAPPMDPMAGGGGPPMDPMAMGGGAPPMDPSMGDPAAGAPIVQIGMQDLAGLAQMLQGGAPGAPAEPGKPKGAGGKNEGLELKIDALTQKLDTLIGFFAAQTGMSPQELVTGTPPSAMGASESLGPEEGMAELPQMSEGEAPPAEAGAPMPGMPPLQPQAEKKPASKPKQLHDLVGALLS